MVRGADGLTAGVSSDGETLAFATRPKEDEQGRSESSIATIGLDGPGLQVLTPPDFVTQRGMAISPDDGTIVFNGSDVTSFGQQGLFALDPGESEPRALTYDWLDGRPAFSPDGKQLLFTRVGERGGHFTPYEIWSVNLDGSQPQPRWADKKKSYEGPSFSPDGRWIVYSRHKKVRTPDSYTLKHSIHRMRPNGAKDQRLTAPTEGVVATAFFSPDGERIAYMNGGQIYVMQADGSNQHRVRGISRSKYHILYGWARG